MHNLVAPKIEAYASELNQVWTNLIDNAVDAMGGQGELLLRTAARNGHVVVEIGAGQRRDGHRKRVAFTVAPCSAGRRCRSGRS